jgi:PPOX class probable F420-dependent enzyme
MRRDLPLADLADFLALPLVAVFATYRKDGNVLLSPVWHQWRDGGFDVLSAPDDIKVRHLRRDPRASILVYGNDLPYCGVEIRTTAQLHEIDRAEIVREMSIRYRGREAGETYAAESADSILIRLEPGNVRTWDFADEISSESRVSRGCDLEADSVRIQEERRVVRLVVLRPEARSVQHRTARRDYARVRSVDFLVRLDCERQVVQPWRIEEELLLLERLPQPQRA